MVVLEEVAKELLKTNYILKALSSYNVWSNRDTNSNKIQNLVLYFYSKHDKRLAYIYFKKRSAIYNKM